MHTNFGVPAAQATLCSRLSFKLCHAQLVLQTLRSLGVLCTFLLHTMYTALELWTDSESQMFHSSGVHIMPDYPLTSGPIRFPNCRDPVEPGLVTIGCALSHPAFAIACVEWVGVLRSLLKQLLYQQVNAGHA
jgi:hypothetical protein